MFIGYMRPSQDDLNCENQRKNLTEIGCEHMFTEDHSSPKKRVQLKKMLENLNEGDKIVITRLSILADSTRHLVELFEVIDNKKAFVFSIKEKIDTINDSGYSFQTILKHLLEFQSDLISEKTKKGLSEAKQKGISTGRPRKPDRNVQRAIEMYQSKQFTLSEIKAETGISKSTLYRYLEN